MDTIVSVKLQQWCCIYSRQETREEFGSCDLKTNTGKDKLWTNTIFKSKKSLNSLCNLEAQFHLKRGSSQLLPMCKLCLGSLVIMQVSTIMVDSIIKMALSAQQSVHLHSLSLTSIIYSYIVTSCLSLVPTVLLGASANNKMLFASQCNWE